MALPANISNSGGTTSGVAWEKNLFTGPICDDNGNLYVVTEDDFGNFRPAMRKSTDGGNTWAEVATSRPIATDCEAGNLVYDPVADEVHCVRMRSTGPVDYFRFRPSSHATSPDTWALGTSIVNVHGPAVAAAEESSWIVRRSNGHLLVFYRTDPSGTDERIAYRKSTNNGAAWGSEVIIDTTSGKDFTCVQAVVGESDKVHIFYFNETDQNLLHRSLDSADSLSAAETVNDNPVWRSGTVGETSCMANQVLYYDDAGTERIYVAWFRSSDSKLVGAEVTDDGTPGAEEVISDVAVYLNPANMGAKQGVASLAMDGADIYAIYADSSTHDIWLAKKTGGSWGTDIELVDATECIQICCNVFTHNAGNGSNKVLGYWWSLDEGTDSTDSVWYNEYVVQSSAQFAYASADSADGSWTDQGGGTSLFAAIDETTPSDSDYIRSELTPVNSGCRVKLGTLVTPQSGTRTLRWRIGKDATGGGTIDMKAQIRQGGGNTLGGGTLVQEFTRNGVDAATTYEETITGTVTDYSDLYLEFYANQV